MPAGIVSVKNSTKHPLGFINHEKAHNNNEPGLLIQPGVTVNVGQNNGDSTIPYASSSYFISIYFKDQQAEELRLVDDNWKLMQKNGSELCPLGNGEQISLEITSLTDIKIMVLATGISEEQTTAMWTGIGLAAGAMLAAVTAGTLAPLVFATDAAGLGATAADVLSITVPFGAKAGTAIMGIGAVADGAIVVKQVSDGKASGGVCQVSVNPLHNELAVSVIAAGVAAQSLPLKGTHFFTIADHKATAGRLYKASSQ